jgi:hypothetical protein
MPFTTAKGATVVPSSHGKTRAAALLAAHADRNPSQASDLLADELQDLREKLVQAQHSSEILPSLMRAHRNSIDFETFEKKDGEDWDTEERALWISRLKAIELDLVAGLNTVPKISMRIAFAAPMLLENRRATIAQLEDNLQFARGRLLLLQVGAAAPEPVIDAEPSVEEDHLVDAFNTLSKLSGD